MPIFYNFKFILKHSGIKHKITKYNHFWTTGVFCHIHSFIFIYIYLALSGTHNQVLKSRIGASVFLYISYKMNYCQTLFLTKRSIIVPICIFIDSKLVNYFYLAAKSIPIYILIWIIFSKHINTYIRTYNNLQYMKHTC